MGNSLIPRSYFFTSRNLLSSILFLLVSSTIFAEEIPEFFTPIRPLGMGSAFTAIANDEDAIWTNPAGVVRVRKPRSRKTVSLVKIPNLIVGANKEAKTSYGGLKTSQEQNVESVVSQSEDLEEKPMWARASLFPIIMFDYGKNSPAALGLFSNTTTKIVVDKENPDQARMAAISDVGGTISVASTTYSNLMSVGLQLRPVYRYAYEDTVPTSTVLDKTELQKRLQDGSNKSSAVAIDAGIMFTLADFWFPTVAASVFNIPTGCREGYLNPFAKKRQNVCGTKYVGKFGNEEALSTVDPTDIRVGLSILPRLTRQVALRFALDAHHLYFMDGTNYYGLSGIEPIKLIHGGVELVLGNPMLINSFSLRAGMNQGFMTFGASLNLWAFSLDFATYGVDVSSSVSSIEDRRYLLGLSMSL